MLFSPKNGLSHWILSLFLLSSFRPLQCTSQKCQSEIYQSIWWWTTQRICTQRQPSKTQMITPNVIESKMRTHNLANTINGIFAFFFFHAEKSRSVHNKENLMGTKYTVCFTSNKSHWATKKALSSSKKKEREAEPIPNARIDDNRLCHKHYSRQSLKDELTWVRFIVRFIFFCCATKENSSRIGWLLQEWIARVCSIKIRK